MTPPPPVRRRASGTAAHADRALRSVTQVEHEKARLPTIQALLKAGWDEGQLQWGPEWRVPATPHDASKREGGKSFSGFPADLVIFDDVEGVGQWDRILAIFEFKQPTLEEGQSQLEIYLGLEPRARVGYWSNGVESLTVFKRADGTFESRKNANVPRPGDDFEKASEKPITYEDLVIPDGQRLRSIFKRLLDAIVSSDSRSTRSDGQLNQLCNLLLIKLDSDSNGSYKPTERVQFQLSADERVTARQIRNDFKLLRSTHTAIFQNDPETELLLDDHTIKAVVYEMSYLNLIEVGPSAVSYAFQVFRRANLKAGEGQYFTPQRVIEAAVKLMDIRPSDKMIDPACGTGGFLIEAFRQIESQATGRAAGAGRTWAHRQVFGIDKDSINVKLARAVMVIMGDGSANIHVGDSLVTDRWATDYPHLKTGIQDGTFTVVLTNPPFGKNLRFPGASGQRGGYSITKAGTRQHKALEIGLVFVERAHQLLVSGGRLGIVLPETYFFSSSYRWFANWLDERFIMRGVVNIPMEAFQGFCRAKTNLYVLEKR